MVSLTVALVGWLVAYLVGALLTYTYSEVTNGLMTLLETQANPWHRPERTRILSGLAGLLWPLTWLAVGLVDLLDRFAARRRARRQACR